MASGLRARLNAIASASPRAPVQAPRAGGLLRREHRERADARLFSLDADGLRRIGWCGRGFRIEDCLFLDTETTGLSGGAGTVAFLVGLGYVEGDEFVVEQLLMRDYGDEPELIDCVARRMARFGAVCSFNGKNFDLPLLKSRFVMCRRADDWRELEQLDLLYPARRTWKMRIGSCRLSRLEEMILGAPRGEDLPGSEVPQRYFDYLKSGDLSLLKDILEHNRRDIVTLGALLSELCALYAAPGRATQRADIFSMGRALENQGELRPARELYRIAAAPPPAGSISSLSGDALAGEAAWRLYLLCRKNRDAEGMREILEKMALRRQKRDLIYVELSKLYEHRYKNPRRALRYADLAANYAGPEQAQDIARRRARLRGKIDREAERKKDNGFF